MVAGVLWLFKPEYTHFILPQGIITTITSNTISSYIIGADCILNIVWGLLGFVFERSFMLSKAAFIQPKYSKSNNFVKLQFKIVVFCVWFNYVTLIYSCDAKLNFQHNYSSLQCHMITQRSFEYREYFFSYY